MTSTELERLIRERLAAAGLAAVLDEYSSQVMEFPDGLFAEIVLKDGRELAKVEGLLRELREALAKQQVEVEVVVRSRWDVKNVEDPHPAVGISGGIRAALAFPVSLSSGSLTTEVEVDVSRPAIDAIRNRLKVQTDKELDENKVVKEVVREFLRFQLSLGGESYWDPIRYPRQELSETGLQYLIGHGAVGQTIGV